MATCVCMCASLLCVGGFRPQAQVADEALTVLRQAQVCGAVLHVHKRLSSVLESRAMHETGTLM